MSDIEYNLSVYPRGTQLTAGIPFNSRNQRLDLTLFAHNRVRMRGSEVEVPDALVEAILAIRPQIIAAAQTKSSKAIPVQVKKCEGWTGYSGEIYVCYSQF